MAAVLFVSMVIEYKCAKSLPISAKECKDEPEDLNDVHEEKYSSQDVFFGREFVFVTAHNHLKT